MIMTSHWSTGKTRIMFEKAKILAMTLCQSLICYINLLNFSIFHSFSLSMDLVTIDVTRLPEAELSPGMSVEIMGLQQSADALAAQADTIGYEILTSLGRRYQRHYLPGMLD